MAAITPPVPIPVGDALRSVARLGIDTAPFIYFVEAHSTYYATCEKVFQQVQKGHLTAYTSVLTLTETLPHPLRNADRILESTYRDMLLSTNGIIAFSIDSSIAAYAADLRARYGLRTPDALQIVTAILAGCDAFLTGDKGLRRVTELPILVLDELRV